jgi:nitrate/nitrite transporter NarK
MLQRQGTVRSDLSFTAGVLGLCCMLALPMLVDEAVGPRAASKFVWPNAALLRIAVLGSFGLLAEGAIADWASVYLHSNVGVTLPLAAAGYAAYAIAMAAARFSGDWLAQRVSGKNILQVLIATVVLNELLGSPAAARRRCPGQLALTVLDLLNDFREQPVLHRCSVRVVDDIT